MPTYPPISARLSPAELIALRKLYPDLDRTKALSGCIGELTHARKQLARMAKQLAAASKLIRSFDRVTSAVRKFDEVAK